MRIRNSVAVIAMSAMLSGCFMTGKKNPELPPIIENRPAPIQDTRPAPMELQDVEWQVYTPEELSAQVAQDQAAGRTDVVYYVLTEDEFRALGMNLAEMRRYIEDQADIHDSTIAAIRINEGENRGTPQQ